MKHYVAGTDVTYSSAGFAELQMEITLIQFSSNSTSKVFNSSRSGTIHWEGGGKSAKGCEAMNCCIIE